MKYTWTNKNFSFVDEAGNITHPMLTLRASNEHEAMMVMRALVGVDLTNWTLVGRE